MVFVLTADQRDSRHHRDAVEAILPVLAPVSTQRAFERTAGDELQGVLAAALSVAEAIVVLMDSGQWHVGIGVGRVDSPLPASTRAGRGPAFVAARAAVELAKRRGSGIEVAAPGDTDRLGPAPSVTRDATTGCQLVADLLHRRTPAGREAVQLMRAGATQALVARRLGISRQAVGQRLTAARWQLELGAMPMLAHLLERADRDEEARP